MPSQNEHVIEQVFTWRPVPCRLIAANSVNVVLVWTVCMCHRNSPVMTRTVSDSGSPRIHPSLMMLTGSCSRYRVVIFLNLSRWVRSSDVHPEKSGGTEHCIQILGRYNIGLQTPRTFMYGVTICCRLEMQKFLQKPSPDSKAQNLMRLALNSVSVFQAPHEARQTIPNTL